MELVGIIAFFLLIAGMAWAATYVIDQANKREAARKPKPKPIVWEVVTTSSLGDVMVAVRRNRDLIVVAKIPNGARNWEDLVIEAQSEAARRAAILNAEV